MQVNDHHQHKAHSHSARIWPSVPLPNFFIALSNASTTAPVPVFIFADFGGGWWLWGRVLIGEMYLLWVGADYLHLFFGS